LQDLRRRGATHVDRLGNHPGYPLAQNRGGVRLQNTSRPSRKQPTAMGGSGRGVLCSSGNQGHPFPESTGSSRDSLGKLGGHLDGLSA
jgi:hypothetical protein